MTRALAYLTVGFTLAFSICVSVALTLISVMHGWNNVAFATLLFGSLVPLPLVIIGGWLPIFAVGATFLDPTVRGKVEGIIAALTLPYVAFMSLSTTCYLIATYRASVVPSWFVLLPLILSIIWVYGPWTDSMDADGKKRTKAVWRHGVTMLGLLTAGYVFLSNWAPKEVKAVAFESAWGKEVMKVVPGGSDFFTFGWVTWDTAMFTSLLGLGIVLFLVGSFKTLAGWRKLGTTLVVVSLLLLGGSKALAWYETAHAPAVVVALPRAPIDAVPTHHFSRKYEKRAVRVVENDGEWITLMLPNSYGGENKVRWNREEDIVTVIAPNGTLNTGRIWWEPSKNRWRVNHQGDDAWYEAAKSVNPPALKP